jgi:membrane protease subunit (stomatin/prohibitin family)
LSKFCAGGKSIPDIQAGLEDFAADVDEAVEQKHHWGTLYGLSVIDIQPAVIEWDEESQKTVDEFRKTAMQGQAQAAAMGAIGQAMAQNGGAVGAAYSQATIAQGFKAAGENQSAGGGATGMFGVGMALNQMGGAGGLVTPVGGGAAAAPAAPAATPAPAAPAAETPAAPAPEAPATPETPEAPAADTPATPETPAAQ